MNRLRLAGLVVVLSQAACFDGALYCEGALVVVERDAASFDGALYCEGALVVVERDAASFQVCFGCHFLCPLGFFVSNFFALRTVGRRTSAKSTTVLKVFFERPLFQKIARFSFACNKCLIYVCRVNCEL